MQPPNRLGMMMLNHNAGRRVTWARIVGARVNNAASLNSSQRPILCVLAGGRSSRFESSKLAVRIGGMPVLAWLARRLGRELGWSCWVSLAPGAALPAGAGDFDRIVFDEQAYAGPLAGISTVLSAAHGDFIVVFVPADMPLMRADILERYVQRLRTQPRCALVMGRWIGGDDEGDGVEPLPLACRSTLARPLVRRAMSRGVTGPYRLSRWPGVQMQTLSAGHDRDAWLNLNYRADLVELRKRVGRVNVG